jgi:malonyl CoA-acyl carrier protein transacylase
LQDASDAASSAMASVIGLDSEKVQQLCDAANDEVDEKEQVQIANFLCPVSVLSDPINCPASCLLAIGSCLV